MLYNNIDIDIDTNTINQLVDELLDEASRSVDELTKLSVKDIKQAAKNYLLIIENEKVRIKQLEDALNIQKKYVAEQKKNFSSKSELKSSQAYIEQRENIKRQQKDQTVREAIINIYKASLAFQDLLNGVIGQEMVITYLASTSKKVGVYNIPLKEAFKQGILNIDITSKTYEISMRFRGGYNKLERLANDVDSVVSKMEAGIPAESVDALNTTYHEVARRFKSYKGQNKNGKEVGIVLWHPNSGKWFKMFPSSLGDINEAYAAYYLRGVNYPSMTGMLENDIDTFMHLVAEVDSAAGLMLGDISAEEKDIEYAVKSAGASTLSLTQIENLAREIVSNTKWKPSDLKNMKKDDAQKGVLRNFIEELTLDAASKPIADAIEKVGQSIKI